MPCGSEIIHGFQVTPLPVANKSPVRSTTARTDQQAVWTILIFFIFFSAASHTAPTPGQASHLSFAQVVVLAGQGHSWKWLKDRVFIVAPGTPGKRPVKVL